MFMTIQQYSKGIPNSVLMFPLPISHGCPWNCTIITSFSYFATSNLADYLFKKEIHTLPFSPGTLCQSSASMPGICCSCCCCCFLIRFPSLPALKIFSPKLIFLILPLKSSFLDKGSLDAGLVDSGLARREDLDIVNIQQSITCCKELC